jgi:hypothetical protein
VVGMDFFSSYNTILDGLILLLMVVLLYIILKGEMKGNFKTREHKVELLKRDKELADIRNTARKQLHALMDERGHIQHLISDAKKRYMKGDITYEAMKLIVEQYDEKLLRVDERLSEFDYISR